MQKKVLLLLWWYGDVLVPLSWTVYTSEKAQAMHKKIHTGFKITSVPFQMKPFCREHFAYFSKTMLNNNLHLLQQPDILV